MNSDAVGYEKPGPTATCTDPEKESGVLEDTRSLWHELRALSHDHLRLAALETRRAGESVVDMIVAGVMVAVLLNGAWLGLVVAAVLWLVEHGIAASSAVLLAVIFNLLLVLALCGVIRRKSAYLQFPAILRSLKPMPSRQRDNREKS